jgi:hypothetical protein
VLLLEKKIAELSSDLESHRAELVAVGSMDRFADIEQRLIRAENELAAGDVLRDNLRAENEKVSTWEQCSRRHREFAEFDFVCSRDDAC